MKIKISDYELGWLVGILEGEAYFEYNGCSQRVTVGMIDEDTINSVACIMSKILGDFVNVTSIQPKGNRQELFEVKLSGENARQIMRAVAPYMHYRRRARIWQSLNKFRYKKLNLTDIKFDISPLLTSMEQTNERSILDDNRHGRDHAGRTGDDPGARVETEYEPGAEAGQYTVDGSEVFDDKRGYEDK